MVGTFYNVLVRHRRYTCYVYSISNSIVADVLCPPKSQGPPSPTKPANPAPIR